MAQTHAERHPERPSDEEVAKAGKNLKDDALAADIDALLDEIDDVLEVNAEEFVNQFVQKGGE